jgi:hypothetical protein
LKVESTFDSSDSILLTVFAGGSLASGGGGGADVLGVREMHLVG